MKITYIVVAILDFQCLHLEMLVITFYQRFLHPSQVSFPSNSIHVAPILFKIPHIFTTFQSGIKILLLHKLNQRVGKSSLCVAILNSVHNQNVSLSWILSNFGGYLNFLSSAYNQCSHFCNDYMIIPWQENASSAHFLEPYS